MRWLGSSMAASLARLGMWPKGVRPYTMLYRMQPKDHTSDRNEIYNTITFFSNKLRIDIYIRKKKCISTFACSLDLNLIILSQKLMFYDLCFDLGCVLY